MKNYHQKSSLGLYILLFVAAAIQFATVSAQLLCYSSSDYQCNGTLIEDIDSVSDCCSMSLSDAQWYIQHTNSSLDSNDTLECLACIKMNVGFEKSYLEIEEDFSKMELCVNISYLSNANDTAFDFQLAVSTEKGTAFPSQDFVPFKNLLLETFTNAAQRHCFEVEIKGDKDTESYEEFNVILQPQQDGGLYYPQTIEPDTVTIRILDNDYYLGFEQTSYEVMEGDGEVEMCVISKGPPFLKPVTLTMATVLSAGHEDTDFVSTASDMTFSKDQLKACTRIQIINDAVAEEIEYFHVFLTPQSGIKVHPNLASVKIIDDDVGDSFSIERRRYFTSEAADSVEVCVVHDSGVLQNPVNLTLCTSRGNAINSYDYVSVVSVLAFNSSSPSKRCISIPLLDDHRPEPMKKFNVLLITEHPTTLVSRGIASVTIRDNDNLPVMDSNACTAEDLELVTAQKESEDAVVQSIKSVFSGLINEMANASFSEVSKELYQAISSRFNESITDSGFIKFTEAISEISSGYALACSSPPEARPTAEDIPKLMKEFSAGYEEGNSKLLEIRSIYGQMLCLSDLLSESDEPAAGRKRRQSFCPDPENCMCPAGGISESIICTCEFFECLDEGDQLRPMFLDFDTISCLAFVIDTTGSMKDEINLAIDVIKDFLGSEEEGGCYLLVPFNDDGTGPGLESNIRLSHRTNLIGDHISLLQALESSFQPNSGGDCREYSYKAINQALDHEFITGVRTLQPGSQVIVLTDAPPKGDLPARNTARERIITAAKEMQVCMHFFLPGDTFNCLVDYPDGIEEYQNISSETGGVVIDSGFMFSEFASTYSDHPCRHVTRQLTRRRRDITEEQSCHVFHVSTLSYLLKLTAKTRQRKVTVTRPDNTMVELEVVNSRGGKDKLALLSETEPQSGEWRACVEEGSLEVSSETRVSMDFTALYYAQGFEDASLYLTPSPPPGCTTVRISVSSSRSDMIYSSQIQLLAESGEVAASAELDKCGLSWTANLSLPSPGSYSYQLEGQDLYTNPFIYFTRKTVDYVSGQDYYSLNYTGSDVVVEVGELVELKFLLESTNPYGPTTFTLAAERVAGFSFFADPSEVTLSPGQSAVVKAVYLPASANLDAGSSYKGTLTATNGCVSLSASNDITIMEEAPPPTLDTNVCGCENGGTCTLITLGPVELPVCSCPPGYRGSKCEFSTET